MSEKTTDEQTTIDGVDVSGCDYFAKRKERFLGILQERCKCEMYYNEDCLCEVKADCYYKQLKRKEQECEELKEELQKYKDDEQQEKEMQKLYSKFNGSSLIEKRNPYEN